MDATLCLYRKAKYKITLLRLVSSVEQRITVFKLLGWVLRIVGIIILIGIFIDIVSIVPSLPEINLLNWIPQIIPLVIAYAVLQWGSGHVFSQADHEQKSLEEKMIGYVTSNNMVNLDMLSRWTGIPQRRVADLLARLSANGRLSGCVIDIPSQTIRKESLGKGVGLGQNPVIPSPPPIQTPPNPLDEAVRLKAKLYELEVLKKQGRISESEYNEIKDELERKLVNLDTGTQVY